MLLCTMRCCTRLHFAAEHYTALRSHCHYSSGGSSLLSRYSPYYYAILVTSPTPLTLSPRSPRPLPKTMGVIWHSSSRPPSMSLTQPPHPSATLLPTPRSPPFLIPLPPFSPHPVLLPPLHPLFKWLNVTASAMVYAYLASPPQRMRLDS